MDHPEQLALFRVRHIQQQKVDGSIKERQLSIPNDDVMRKHDQMLKLMYGLGIEMPHATASKPGIQLMENVLPHIENMYFYLLDIKDAFPSVDPDTLIAAVWELDIGNEWKYDLERFVLEYGVLPEGGLPMGAPCSAMLFNVYCLAMDKALSALCEASDITYTRYMDDLTFSSPKTIGNRRRRQIRSAIKARMGLKVNHGKSKVHSLKNGPVTITGISIYPDGRIQPRPELMDTIVGWFKSAQKQVDDGQDIDEETMFQLHGWYSVLKNMGHKEAFLVRRLSGRYAKLMGDIAVRH